MIINTKHGDAELVVSTRKEFGDNYTDLLFNGELVITFLRKSLAYIEGMDTNEKECFIMDCGKHIETFIERKEREKERESAKSVISEWDTDTIYSFIVSLHPCEGAAQYNIHDYANRIR